MTETWGLTGPQFLLLYGAGMLVSIVVAVWARRSSRRGRHGPPVGRLSPDDIAYLAGGGAQVVLAAVARMLEHNMVRASRDGTLTVTRVLPQHPLDREIVAMLNRSHTGTTRLRWLRDKYKNHKLVGQVRNRLISLGLVVPQGSQRVGKVIGAATFGVLFMIGVARHSAGNASGKPVGYLTLLLTVTVLLAGLALWWPGARLTFTGAETLKKLSGRIRQRSTTTDQGDLVLVGSAAAFLVAVGGVAAFPDEDVSQALAMPTAGSGGWFSGSSGGSSSSSGSSSCSTGSSSSSCSSSSSDSGGGGGGGGCGG
ncbi:TIGR04222 domain-containing membrane protein [Crossiella cryophila]|uniref:Uncharacterized protein (TIGR04222 family) n=1 Tax=Crossiella cryophila TaxID=43355 RepID=A0A7W7CCG6_9PSEU|nr:TIGR04222 domain-containing membrane protein [Crossiella cryophila]MBB4676999.1 uncharacterized protein (TIGR04222 family) [Crossiella cryophila]